MLGSDCPREGIGAGEKEGEEHARKRGKATLEDKTEHISMSDETWKPTEPGVDGSKAKFVHVESAAVNLMKEVKKDRDGIRKELKKCKRREAASTAQRQFTAEWHSRTPVGSAEG
ncbi:hypothetical protein LR48_Vigan10g149500 [Vigna angularis]|uniref:Uncharacterized protein n=1 Tax=Phaseolus angularis TaxID=3914 RepID=A0A0L9VKV2_PHAAN|nr:hypothetical protein LR48_Vigan10g149500 [Vigna angularis]